MKPRAASFALLLLASLFVAAGARLDVKPGHWRMSHEMSFPASSAPPSLFEREYCLKGDDLTDAVFAANADCATMLNRWTPSSWEGTISCPASGRVGTFEVKAESRERLVGIATEGAGEAAVRVKLVGQWLSPDCPRNLQK